MAHEINNPLFIIRSYLQMLKEMNLGEASSANLDNMDREMTRIADIVGSLISFSKIKEPLENRISIGEVLEDVLLLLEHNISIKGIRLEREKELSPGKAEIVGDENRIKQLFMSLLLNSIDAVLAGGLIRVILSANEEDRFGEIQNKIFNPI